MNARLLLSVCAALFATGAFAAHPVPKSDLVALDKRRVTVELADKLSRPPLPAQLPENLALPFNPPGFDQPDPEELRAAAVAAAAAARAATAPRPAAGTPAASRPLNDRETLAAIAAKIPSTGTLMQNGKPLLVVGKNRIEAGAHFTVTFSTQDYDLELVSIDRTTFTLRLRGEEITRPIKTGKSP